MVEKFCAVSQRPALKDLSAVCVNPQVQQAQATSLPIRRRCCCCCFSNLFVVGTIIKYLFLMMAEKDNQQNNDGLNSGLNVVVHPPPQVTFAKLFPDISKIEVFDGQNY